MAKHLSPEELINTAEKSTETADLASALDALRSAVRWKISGLASKQIHERPQGDDLSIGGVLAHLAYIEDYWFNVVLHGEKPTKPWDDIEWKTNPNFEWEFALKKSSNALIELWEETVQRSQILWGEALAGGATLDFQVSWDDGGADVPIRWMFQRVIQEYGRCYANLDYLVQNIDTIEDVLPLDF